MRSIYLNTIRVLVLVTLFIQNNAESPVRINSQISQNSKNQEAFILANLANQILTTYTQSRFRSENKNNPSLQNPVNIQNSPQLASSQTIRLTVNQNRNELSKLKNVEPQTPHRLTSDSSNQTRSKKNSEMSLSQNSTSTEINSSPAISYFALVPITNIPPGLSSSHQEYFKAFSSIINPFSGDRALVDQSLRDARTSVGNAFNPLVAIIRPAVPGVASSVRNAKRSEFPYIIDLRQCSEDLNRAKCDHSCGGSIWNRNFIITAAHCFFDSNGQRDNSKFVIVAGEYELNYDEGTEQTVQAKNIYVHPNYKGVTEGFDIAVVELSKSLNFVECKVEAGIFRDVEKATKAKIAGWGGIPGISRTPSILQAGEIDIYDKDTCRNRYVKNNNNGMADPESVVCGIRKNGELRTDVCAGDSGGPLECDDGTGSGYICGLVSYGQSCADRTQSGTKIEEDLGVYTKIAFYQNFIEKMAGLNDNGGVKGQNCYTK